jgi:hypothetical protein
MFRINIKKRLKVYLRTVVLDLLKMKLTALVFLAALTMAELNGDVPCRPSKDPFYRYSNRESRFDGIHVAFAEENILKAQYSREDPNATYTGTSIPPGINDGYNATPSGHYKNGGENLIDKENNGTYTGTSIPPGVNDGYFATPIGHYKTAGGSYTNVINQSNLINN